MRLFASRLLRGTLAAYRRNGIETRYLCISAKKSFEHAYGNRALGFSQNSFGYYIYVGSAFGPGGVLSRVSRHCRKAKSKNWHIDYLREFATPISIWYSNAPVHLEHRWAEALAKMKHTTPVLGFGCSDCRCEAHLFFTAMEPELGAFASAVRQTVKSWYCEAVN